MLTSIVGINWGDEGKGRMVDLLSADYDVVVRYQGGNNAGHTVVNERGRFVMNLLPSGILRPETANVLGPGIVIDLEHLWNEVRSLEEAGIGISPEHLILSDRATICLPFHKLLDCLEEDRLGDRKFGSTRRGISPVYADKYMKKALRMGDLLHGESLRQKVEALLEWKNLVISGGYGHAPVSADEVMDWLERFGNPFDRLRHLSLHLRVHDARRLRPDRRGDPLCAAGQLHRHHEGVFQLRRRGTVPLRVLRDEGRGAARGGRRVRGGYRQTAARRGL